MTGEMLKIRENGATSGVGVLAAYAYDDLGRRTSLTRGNGTAKSYTYDAVSRLASLGEDLAGTSGDLSQSFTYNPASQVATVTRSNDSYAWSDHYNLTRNYGSNGLNQYTASGSITPTYDAKGNLTSAGGTTYAYSSENLLTSASGGITLAYDPMLRLYQVAGGSGGTRRHAYDGQDLIAEYNGSNVMLRRYVHGPGSDEPLVWYEGSGTSDRRFLHSDERGSVIATSNSSGATLSTNAYDEYGIPKSTNTGRFQYTGQTWLPELGMYHYKTRIYSPTLGRFLQTDKIGYGDGMNLYAYVGGDPVNFSDPMGLCMAVLWGRFRHNKDWTEVELLETWVTLNGCGPPPVFGSDGPGDGGDSGGNAEPAETPTDLGEAVVTGTPIFFRASVEIKYVDGLALWMHFMNGGGETLCLNRSQFAEIVANAKRIGKPNVGKRYTSQTVSFYGSYLGKVYGNGTMIYDNKTGQAIGYWDYYNFDAANRSLGAEIATRFGSLGYLAGGTDFAFGYPCE